MINGGSLTFCSFALTFWLAVCLCLTQSLRPSFRLLSAGADDDPTPKISRSEPKGAMLREWRRAWGWGALKKQGQVLELGECVREKESEAEKSALKGKEKADRERRSSAAAGTGGSGQVTRRSFWRSEPTESAQEVVDDVRVGV